MNLTTGLACFALIILSLGFVQMDAKVYQDKVASSDRLTTVYSDIDLTEINLLQVLALHTCEAVESCG